jgi:hypothetical protein
MLVNSYRLPVISLLASNRVNTPPEAWSNSAAGPSTELSALTPITTASASIRATSASVDEIFMTEHSFKPFAATCPPALF